eukprot:14635062-Heterocapsa_arctica.AAC.1
MFQSASKVLQKLSKSGPKVIQKFSKRDTKVGRCPPSRTHALDRYETLRLGSGPTHAADLASDFSLAQGGASF